MRDEYKDSTLALTIAGALRSVIFICRCRLGKTIHENVTCPNATGGALDGGEKAKGPLMFQGDHGIVAYRNIRLKEVAFRGEKK